MEELLQTRKRVKMHGRINRTEVSKARMERRKRRRNEINSTIHVDLIHSKILHQNLTKVFIIKLRIVAKMFVVNTTNLNLILTNELIVLVSF